MKRRKALLLIFLLTFTACTVDEVLDTINVAAQVAAEIGAALGPINPVDAAIVTNLSGIASAGVLVLQDIYQQYTANPATTDVGKVLAAVQAAKANLSQALAAAHITDPHTLQVVTAWANLIINTLDAVASAIEPAQPANTPSGVRMAVIPFSPQAVALAWQEQVCSGNYACSKLVHVPKHGLRKLW